MNPEETAIPPESGDEAQPAANAWLSVVKEKVRQLRFGVVQITIHEGKVVQIDSTERTRLEVPGELGRRPRGSSRRPPA